MLRPGHCAGRSHAAVQPCGGPTMRRWLEEVPRSPDQVISPAQDDFARIVLSPSDDLFSLRAGFGDGCFGPAMAPGRRPRRMNAVSRIFERSSLLLCLQLIVDIP